MCHQNINTLFVPGLYVPASFQPPDPQLCFFQRPLHSFQIMLKIIEYQHRLPVQLLYQFHKGLYLVVMNLDDFTGSVLLRAVYRPVSQLQQLTAQNCGAACIQHRIPEFQNSLLLHFVIGLLGFCVQLYVTDIIHAFRQLQVVLRRQADADIPDPLLNLLFCAFSGIIAEDRRGISAARCKILIPVFRNRPSQPLSPVQQIDLRPQVHIAVGCGCPRQLVQTADVPPDTPQRFESFRLVAFETA